MTSKQTQVLRTEEALSVYDTLKMALEALEWSTSCMSFDDFDDMPEALAELNKAHQAITAIKAALEAHKALMSVSDEAQSEQVGINGLTEAETNATASVFGLVNTTPPTQQSCSQRPSRSDMTWVNATTWRGLTEEDKKEYIAQDFGGNRLDAMDWAEKRLKEKNTK